MPTIELMGRRLHYVATGAPPPTLLLVHGAGGDHGTWTRQLESLADSASVVALDLPGHGGSSGDGCCAVADYAAVVRAFIAALGRGPVVLGGHSMGGAIAQAVALDAPALLGGIVLVGTGARLRVFPELLALLESDYAAAVAFVAAHAWSASSPAGLREGARRTTLATPAAVTRGDYLACDGFDVMGRVGAIRLPALVIVGEDDRLTPPRYGEYLARAIAGARLVRVPRAGHYVSLEQPEAVDHAIRGFLLELR